MNSDQVTSIVRTIFKIVGTAMTAHGMTKTASWFNAEDIIGLVVTAIGVVMSHVSHKDDAVPPVSGNPMNVSTKVLLLMVFALPCFFVSGCHSTPQAAAYQTVGTSATSVEALMGEWNVWVKSGKASVPQQISVRDAYRKYQATMLAVCDAGIIFSAYSQTNSAGATGLSAALQIAIANASQSISDVQNLITAFKN